MALVRVQLSLDGLFQGKSHLEMDDMKGVALFEESQIWRCPYVVRALYFTSFSWVFHSIPSSYILRYHYFWERPYEKIILRLMKITIFDIGK